MTATASHEHWMRLALEEAALAARVGEVPVGAVLVKDGRLIARAHNGPVAGHDPTAHAEVLALRAAAHLLGNYRLDGCELFVTLEPCPMCAGAMLHARLDSVVFGAFDPKTGAAGSVTNLFEMPALNHRTRVTSGLLAAEAATLLRDFFKPRRVNSSPVREDALRTPESCLAPLGLPWHLSRYTSELPSLRGLRLHWFDGRGGAVVDEDQRLRRGEGARAEGLVPYIALHGMADWSWRYSPELLAGGPVLAIDLPGFGLSDKPKKEAAHTLDWHVAVLAEWLDQRGLGKSGQTLRWLAPNEMRGLVHALATRLPGHLDVVWDNRAALPDALRHAPYPDRGHMAGPRAMCALLDN